MYYINGIWLLLLGLIAAPDVLISRKPETRKYFDKLVPHQGWIGIASIVFGFIHLIKFLRYLRLFDWIPVGMITYLAGVIVTLALGFLLGVGTLKNFINSGGAKTKMDSLRANLAPKQGSLGTIGIVIGLWILFYRIFDLRI